MPLEADHVVCHLLIGPFQAEILHLQLLRDEAIDPAFNFFKILDQHILSHQALHLILELLNALIRPRLKLLILGAYRRQYFEFFDKFFDTFLHDMTILSVEFLLEESWVVKFECMWALPEFIRNGLRDSF